MIVECGACGKPTDASQKDIENTKKKGFIPEVFCTTECCVTYLSRLHNQKMRAEYVQ